MEADRKLDAKFSAEQALLAALTKPRDYHKKDEHGLKQLNITTSDMQTYRLKNQDVDGIPNPVVTEVRELHHQRLEPTTVSTRENKIAANALRRQDRHTSAQNQYQTQLKAISEALEGDILRISDHIKDELAQVAITTRNIFSQLSNDAWLTTSTHDMMVDGWKQLEVLCKGRTDSIVHFGAGLEAVEQARSTQVGKELQTLTETCVAAAHLLAPEVERLIEDESHELNSVLIANRRAHCHLVSRLLKEDIHMYVDVRTQWEGCERHWRQLNHDQAIAFFRTTLTSPLYTAPPSLHAILDQLRHDQLQVHTTERLEILTSLNTLVVENSLTSEKVHANITRLAIAFKHEEERNAEYFRKLFDCQRTILDDARRLREELRATCHLVGAKAEEGQLHGMSSQLTKLLESKELEEFFRISGGLRAELASIEERLASPDMIYQENVAMVLPRVALLVHALPLESILDTQGKSNERKAIQSTLERLRKAPKNEILGILPILLSQTASLATVQGLDDMLHMELDDIVKRIEGLIEENEKQQASPTKPGKSLGLEGFQIADIHAIRKVQRRLGTLVYATDLPPSLQTQLKEILQALHVQSHANQVVDEIVGRECDELIEERARELQALVATVGSGLEAQTNALHRTCDRFARFFYQLIACVERYEEKTRIVHLTVMDLLDTLKDTHDTNVAAFESDFSTRRSALRHASDEASLEEEFRGCLTLLESLEEEYRKYNKKVSMASTNHPTAITRQNNSFLNELCSSFGLVSPVSDAPTAIDQLLSAEVIENSVNNPTTEIPVPHAQPKHPNAASSEPVTTNHVVGESENVVNVPIATVYTSRNGSQYLENATIESILGLIFEMRVLLPGEDPIEDDMPEVVEETLPPPVVQPIPEPSPSDPKTKSTPRSGPSAVAPPTTEPEAPQAVIEPMTEEAPAIDIPLESVIAVLDITGNTLIPILLNLRDVMITSFEGRSAGHLNDACAESKTRVDAYAFLLEECLRMHWPRKGRTDVQIYQPRAGELVSHRQRHGRHVKNVLKKLGHQETNFLKLHEDAIACFHGQENLQLGLQAQLLMQTSLAALQGLESRSKKSFLEFKSVWTDMIQTKMNLFLTDEPASLIGTCRELVTTCSHQIFPDLIGCDVISGCDYHPDEIKMVQAIVADTESQIDAAVEARREKVKSLEAMDGKLNALLAAFKSRYQSCLQNLSMKEGLGQKYGMPRRNAQERQRSEMTRSDNMASSIDELLQTLLNMNSSTAPPLGPKEPSNTARRVRKILLELRQLMYNRGIYLGVLKNKQQLQPKNISNDMEAATKYDADIMNTDEPPPKPYLSCTKQFEEQCIADTKALFLAEGKPMDENSIPDALKTYLHEQHEKAILYVQHQISAFRTQVQKFEDVLNIAPQIAMEDIVRRAQSSIQSKVHTIVEEFEKRYNEWGLLKESHKNQLTPQLCSPNQVAAVDALCQKEALRTSNVQADIKSVRFKLLEEHVKHARVFHERLLSMFHAIMAILDTCIMKVDLVSADDVEEQKRKSLKRLRKALRKLEEGDPLAVDLTSDEKTILKNANETQRYPKRSWPGLPITPTYELPPSILLTSEMSERKEEILQNGACISYLTDIHRNAITSRNSTYSEYYNWYNIQMETISIKYSTLLEDEEKWFKNWEQLIKTMRFDR